jgi:hypothetical protein
MMMVSSLVADLIMHRREQTPCRVLPTPDAPLSQRLPIARNRQGKSPYPASKELVSKEQTTHIETRRIHKIAGIRQGLVDRALEPSGYRKKRAIIRNQSISIERMCA